MSLWFKALIIVIWLTVPVVGSLLIRSSYQHYLVECSIQRQDCQDRGAFLTKYCGAYIQLGNRVENIASSSDHRAWVRDFRAMEQKEQSASTSLRPQEPIHFPTADAELGIMEADLRELKDNTKDAAFYRLDYINAGERQESLQAVVNDLEVSSYYYKQIGMEGIYLQMQENLARVEDDIRVIRRQRRTYSNLLEDCISDADGFRKGIERGLNDLQDNIDSDEDLTYRNQLHLRLADFNLPAELKVLIRGRAETL